MHGLQARHLLGAKRNLCLYLDLEWAVGISSQMDFQVDSVDKDARIRHSECWLRETTREEPGSISRQSCNL
jgi:hypothetical protein